VFVCVCVCVCVCWVMVCELSEWVVGVTPP
jgi:hypothetical protein